MELLVFVLGLAAYAEAVVLSFPPQHADQVNEVKLALNRDNRYDKWLDPARILFRFDEKAYSSEEKSLILKAMERISDDMSNCIAFKEYNPDADAGWDNIYISKTLNDGSVPPTCFSFYGRVLRAAGQGQKMAIHNGPNGCMEAQRDVMKILVNVLGLRNEYNRPDRDLFMKVFPENLQPELRNSNLLSAYNASQVDTVDRPFDYHSVTIPNFNKYGIVNSTVFELPANRTFPQLDRLSQDDCMGLAWMYGCDAKKCVDPYNAPPPSLKAVDLTNAIQTDNKILIELAPNVTEAAPVAVDTTAAAAETTAAATETTAAATETTAIATETTAVATEAATSPSITEGSVTASIFNETSSNLTETTKIAAVTENATLTLVTEAATENPQNETSATLLLTLATGSPLTVTLADVIVPRKGALDEVNVTATEGPMVIQTVGTAAPEATTAAIEEAANNSLQLKLVFVANQTENATAAAVNETQPAVQLVDVGTTIAATVVVETTAAMTEATTAVANATVSEIAPVVNASEQAAAASVGSIDGIVIGQPVVQDKVQIQERLNATAAPAVLDHSEVVANATLASNATDMSSAERMFLNVERSLR